MLLVYIHYRLVLDALELAGMEKKGNGEIK